MMYRENFVAAVKVNGKVLRENKDTVTLPFGCEYSLLLKNLNSVRALAKVSVDGQDATEGTWLIVPADGSVDLERFIKNGNLNQGNKFKFIERTKEVEEHRGIGAEDGLIRVEYKKEVVPVFQPPIYYDNWIPWDRRWPNRRWDSRIRSVKPMGASGSSMRSVRSQNVQGSYTINSSNSSNSSETSCSNTLNDAGITVAGSESNQQFCWGANFETENVSSVIVLKLRGQVGKYVAYRPVTVKQKAVCITCGKTNKPTSQFCSTCGTSLVLL